MVRVQSIVRVLLVAAVAVSATGVRAEDAQTQTVGVDAAGAAEVVDKTTCVAPEVVANYETKMDELVTERAQWQSQLVAANGQWKKEKSELEGQLAELQDLHKKARKEVTKAQQDAATTVEKLEKQLRETESQHAQVVDKLEKQVGESGTLHAKKLEQLKEQVAALERTVETLKIQVADQTTALNKRDAEVMEANAKLVKSQDQVKTLERDVASSQKKNKALRDELNKLDDKLTISALLSSYYDEGVELASNAVMALRLQAESAQQGTTGVTQALEALETYKKTVTETTGQLYAEHLAATMDPLIAELHLASDPYVKQYQPVVEAEVAKAKKTAIKNYNLALKRAKAARADAIALLQQTDGVAPYAQKIVDASLYVLATPIVLLLVRVVLSLAWFVVRTTFCVATFGYCCGLCARKRSKPKRKGSRKPLSPSPTTTTTTTSATSSSKKAASATSNGKRTGGKKQK